MSSPHGLSNETVQKFIQIFKKYCEIEKVILYGSRAIGQFKQGSDLDLTVIAPTWNLTHLLALENEIDDLLLPYKVDLSLYHSILNQELIAHIQKVGREFYKNSTY